MASTQSDFSYAGTPPSRSSPLHQAAHSGDLKRVQKRLAAGDEVDIQCGEVVDGKWWTMTPLMCATAEGHAEVVRILLQAGANPCAVFVGDGTSVLYAAACYGYLDIVMMLLEAGAEINVLDPRKRSALFAAAYGGHDKVVAALISAGAIVDMPNNEGFSPLMTAALHRREKCVEILLKAKADFSMVAYDRGYTALHAGCRGGSVGVVKMLLSWGADVNFIAKNEVASAEPNVSALFVAAEFRHVDVIKVLLEAGADVDWTNHYSRTLMHLMTHEGQDSVVELLIASHANLEATDREGMSPLMTASHAGAEKCVRLLLNAGCNITKASNIEGTVGFTAMHAAALGGSIAVLKTLVEWGGDVNQADARGRTVLFAASTRGRAQVAKWLLDNGAAPNARDEVNGTALMWAIDLPTVKVLLAGGVSATAVDDNGNTALHHAGNRGCNSGHICFIYKAGCNPTLLNKNGKSPSDSAREAGHADAALLLQMLADKYAHIIHEEKVSEPPTTKKVAELDAKMDAAAAVSSIDDKIKVELSEPSHVVAEEGRAPAAALQRPCMHCQELTHRRCARCRTAYICSRDCQVVTLAQHKRECLAIFEERELADGGKAQEGSG